MDSIFAGIVLYNPDINRLFENVSHIANQVDKVILVDNGSNNKIEIKEILNKFNNVQYIDLLENKGIAYALNVIARETKKANVKWVLTLDQDTVCEDNIISKYRTYLDIMDIGQLTCNYRDRNFEITTEIKQMGSELEDMDWCITSGALLNIKAWESVGGFDELLFIDEVDYDICLTMRENGYHIYKANFTGFIHEIGNGKTLKYGFVEVKTWNHSPIRRYYGARNAIIVAKKHEELNYYRAILGAIKHIILIFVFENQKIKKFTAGVKGLHDGIKENL